MKGGDETMLYLGEPWKRGGSELGLGFGAEECAGSAWGSAGMHGYAGRRRRVGGGGRGVSASEAGGGAGRRVRRRGGEAGRGGGPGEKREKGQRWYFIRSGTRVCLVLPESDPDPPIGSDSI